MPIITKQRSAERHSACEANASNVLGDNTFHLQCEELEKKMLKARILVVDDEAQLLELFVRRLQRFSHKVFKAHSAGEALDILQSTTVDVIVTDFKMDEMNGIELIKSATEGDPTIQGILVTGYLDTETVDSASKSGVFDCFEKPVDFWELRISIEECMQKRLYM